MRVLYVVRSIPEYDKTGTPYAVWRLASMAKQRFGMEVGFLISSPYGKLLRHEFESIPVYMLPPIDWRDNFFADYQTDRREYLGAVDAAIREFCPQVLHVYNFVGLSYQILRLKYLHPELKILRTITHTEDICFNIDPVMYSPAGVLNYCQGPFPPEKCITHYLQENGLHDAVAVRRQFADHHRQLNSYYRDYVDGVVFTGRGFHDFVSGIFRLPKKRWLIPHGVPRPQKASFVPRGDGRREAVVVGFFGGCGPRKGLPVLLQAIRKNSYILRVIKLKVVGGTVENSTYRELLAIQSLYPQQVEVLGNLDDEAMDAAMRSVDLAVLPSLFETYNITLRELLLRGTPVIVSDTFGAEKITPGVNGFVFPRGDADALLAVLERVVADRSLLARLQAGAVQTPIESLEEECVKLMAVYNILIDAK